MYLHEQLQFLRFIVKTIAFLSRCRQKIFKMIKKVSVVATAMPQPQLCGLITFPMQKRAAGLPPRGRAPSSPVWCEVLEEEPGAVAQGSPDAVLFFPSL